MSSTDIDEPRRIKPKIANEDPMRAKLVTERLLRKHVSSVTLNDCALIGCFCILKEPPTASDAPRRTNERIESEDPKFAQSNIDVKLPDLHMPKTARADPSREKLLRDIAAPNDV
jgi:hypothetical protein